MNKLRSAADAIQEVTLAVPFNQFTNILKRADENVPTEMGGTCLDQNDRLQEMLRSIDLEPWTVKVIGRNLHVITVFEFEGELYIIDPTSKQLEPCKATSKKHTVKRLSKVSNRFTVAPSNTPNIFNIEYGPVTWVINPRDPIIVTPHYRDLVDLDNDEERIFRLVLPSGNDIKLTHSFAPYTSRTTISVNKRPRNSRHNHASESGRKIIEEASTHLGLDPDQVTQLVERSLKKLYREVY